MNTKSNVDYSVAWICTVVTIAVCVLCYMLLIGNKECAIVVGIVAVMGLLAFMFTYYLHGKCSNEKEQINSRIKVLEDKNKELEESLKKINTKLDSMDSKFPSNVGDRVSVLEK